MPTDPPPEGDPSSMLVHWVSKALGFGGPDRGLVSGGV